MAGPHQWPEGWSRGGQPADARPPGRGTVEPDHTRVLPPELSPRRGGHPPPPFQRPRPRGRGRRWLGRVLVALVLVVVLVVVLVLFFVSRIDKVDAVRDYPGRPAAGSGTNWLVVGSDSRAGLSDQQVQDLRLGRAGGRRTDTVILVHRPASGPPTLVSLPRDSYVPIPGYGRNKLNAAYALGGPALLVRTVETVTGLRIDHYTEVGFGGFVAMTDAVGGVQLCPRQRIRDRKSGLDVAKGCQQMAGPTALAYVRARYFDPRGDLGRVQRQQEFLGALFERAASPATLLNPPRVVSLADAASAALTIDDGDGPVSLAQLALSMRALAGGNGRRVTVPVADPNYQTSAGSSVRWDRDRALRLFRSLDRN